MGVIRRFEHERAQKYFTPAPNQRILIPHVQDKHFYAIVMDISDTRLTIAVHDSLQTNADANDLRADDPSKCTNMSVWAALKAFVQREESCKNISGFQRIPAVNSLQPDMVSCGYYMMEFISQYLDDYSTDLPTQLHNAKDLTFIPHSSIRARRSDLFNILLCSYDDYAKKMHSTSIMDEFSVVSESFIY